jgi:hypothetical protein
VAQKLRSDSISLVQELISTISHQLPKTEPELVSFRRTLEGPCKLLEAKLLSFGFFSEDTGSTASIFLGPLTAYITDLPSIFADLRRRDILKAAREVVLSDYHNTMMASSGDAAEDELSSAGDIGDPRAALDQSVSFAMQRLKFDSCQISLAACRLLKLIHEVMKQASCATASEEVAFVLYQSARDCLELFTALVPMQFADVIDVVPRMGAVFYNDCLYIAHNCTLITHKYRLQMGKVSEVLEHTVGFCDFLPRFRQLGDRCLVRHIEQQKAALSVLIKKINICPDEGGNNDNDTQTNAKNSRAKFLFQGGSGFGFGGLALAEKISNKFGLTQERTETVPGTDVEISITSTATRELQQPLPTNNDDAAVLVRRHLERLSSQWVGVLQEQVYARVVGHLAEAVLREAMQPVLTAECISEAAGEEISRVYRSLQQIR